LRQATLMSKTHHHIRRQHGKNRLESMSWKSIALVAWIIAAIIAFFLLPLAPPGLFSDTPVLGNLLNNVIESANSSIGLRCLFSSLIGAVMLVLIPVALVGVLWEEIATHLVDSGLGLQLVKLIAKLIWNFLGWFRRILAPAAILGLLGGAISILLDRTTLPLSPFWASAAGIAAGVVVGSTFLIVTKAGEEEHGWLDVLVALLAGGSTSAQKGTPETVDYYDYGLDALLAGGLTAWVTSELGTDIDWWWLAIDAIIATVLAFRVAL